MDPDALDYIFYMLELPPRIDFGDWEDNDDESERDDELERDDDEEEYIDDLYIPCLVEKFDSNSIKIR